MHFWLADAYDRILPESAAGNCKDLSLAGPRGTTLSCQLGVLPTDGVSQWQVHLDGPLADRVRVRLAEFVPVRHRTAHTPDDMVEGHVPGFMPDALIDPQGTWMGAGIARSVWLSIDLPDDDSAPAESTLDVSFTWREHKADIGTIRVNVWAFELPSFELPTTNWFYTDAIVDHYDVAAFSDRYWQIVEGFMRNMVAHNQTAVYVPLITPPLDSPKPDLQLLTIHETAPGKFDIDFSRMEQWLDLAQGAGFKFFEIVHLFTQWGAAYVPRILVERDGSTEPLVPAETSALCDEYRAFLSQLLPQLFDRLDRRGIFDQCIFHLSDEPGERHLENYTKVRDMIREIAPRLRASEALSSFDFHKHGLVDNPIPSIDHLQPFLDAGLTPWTYFCCGQKQTCPNTFLDSKLFRLRALGPIIYRFNLTGFLYWGLNYWYKQWTTQPIDPYHITDATGFPSWVAGDPFVIYPGPRDSNDPVDSIRWETYRDTFNDYRLLKLAEQKVGRDRVLELLTAITGPIDYPHHSNWLREMRSQAAALAGA